ncbi:sensor histidine kinase [Streptococcus sp. CSL10205-OR2]|uniref:sensor histidine kinase n=1 Tax=Streptococcus sp. CSL10205-OR2 TaxID=2980558 RepID=UPI0021DB6BD7|nr:HAMP domain-containing sensor histidine kinase [Streptococcus sp. CSL10205-OR2]MCU9533556.1 HAMP domain-containing histidine kinase [Streptococcus sp. CSL10205-OR2]
MKLKYYIIVGFLVSIFITVLGVFFGASRMLIDNQEVSYVLLMTILASLTGALISLLLLGRIFRSLDQLKDKMKELTLRNFDTESRIQTPLEFKELEASFNQMATELQDSFQSLKMSEKEKAMMVAHLTHDIKTPITSIQATIEGILDGVIPEEEVHDYLKTVNRQTNRLNRLVEEFNILTQETLDPSLQEIKKETIYLDKLLLEILSEFQLKIEKEERQITLSVDPKVAKIQSDYDKLSRILLNIITNAFKYSNEGTKLDIKASGDDDTIRIAISDQGMGIKKEELETIFQRLYRVEASRNMTTGGHGLGLYIARQLAHQLGGEITVASEYGSGSVFTLVLTK